MEVRRSGLWAPGLIVERDFLGENSFVFGVFGSRRGLQANQRTVRKSAISTQPGNQKRIK